MDHASEADLNDALPPYPAKLLEYDEDGNVSSKRDWQEFGFRQIQALRDRLTHFNQSVAPFLKRLTRRRGPQPRKTLPGIVTLTDYRPILALRREAKPLKMCMVTIGE